MSQANVYAVTPVLEASVLADNDVFFVPIEIQSVFDKGFARELTSAVVIDGDDQATEFDLVFFSASVTLGALNAGVTISDADSLKAIGAVSFVAADAVDLINSTMFIKRDIGLVMGGSSSSIWVGGVVRSGTPTYTASGMKILLGFK